MAPIGTVATYLSVDQTWFSGPNDPISGTISLVYKPNVATRTELFGPLHMRIILQGHMKLHVAENRTSHAYIFFDESHLLFRKVEAIFDGPLKISAGKPEYVRYQVTVPEKVEVLYCGLGPIRERLPPSFKTRFEAQAPRQYGHHQGRVEITYTIRAEAEMPGIDLEVVTEPKVPVNYKQGNISISPSSVTATQEVSQMLHVDSYRLLPEDTRPSSLLGMTKATLSNAPKPTFVFTVTCSRIPDNIAAGQSIQLEIRTKVDTEATTALVVPEITLTNGRMDIIARTELYATSLKGVDSPRLDHSTVVHSLNMRTQSPAGSFAKSDNHRKVLQFEVLPSDIACDFSIKKLRRSYRARLELRFLVAGTEAVTMKQSIALCVVPPQSAFLSAPPYIMNGTESSIAAGPSQRRVESLPGQDEHEDLPLYENAVDTARVV